MDINTSVAAVSGADAIALSAAGVRYCAASYVDMHGISKTKMVPIAHHAQMLEGSELFTGAAMDGVPQSVHDEEVAAVPDPASCSILPWKPEIAWFASDLRYKGAPFEACSRNILKRQLDRAAAHGLNSTLASKRSSSSSKNWRMAASPRFLPATIWPNPATTSPAWLIISPGSTSWSAR